MIRLPEAGIETARLPAVQADELRPCICCGVVRIDEGDIGIRVIQFMESRVDGDVLEQDRCGRLRGPSGAVQLPIASRCQIARQSGLRGIDTDPAIRRVVRHVQYLADQESTLSSRRQRHTSRPDPVPVASLTAPALFTSDRPRNSFASASRTGNRQNREEPVDGASAIPAITQDRIQAPSPRIFRGMLTIGPVVRFPSCVPGKRMHYPCGYASNLIIRLQQPWCGAIPGWEL